MQSPLHQTQRARDCSSKGYPGQYGVGLSDASGTYAPTCGCSYRAVCLSAGTGSASSVWQDAYNALSIYLLPLAAKPSSPEYTVGF